MNMLYIGIVALSNLRRNSYVLLNEIEFEAPGRRISESHSYPVTKVYPLIAIKICVLLVSSSGF